MERQTAIQNETRFSAPWGRALKVMTVLSAALLMGIPAAGLTAAPDESALWVFGMVVMPLVILVVAPFFAVLEYRLTPGTLYIERPGWRVRLPLSKLASAAVDPEAMSRSIRTLGNGGMFCFAGLFWNRKLGAYRAFATDPKHAVVLRFSDRTVVVTPGHPEVFAETLRSGARPPVGGRQEFKPS
jgi:hypothetical protein